MADTPKLNSTTVTGSDTLSLPANVVGNIYIHETAGAACSLAGGSLDANFIGEFPMPNLRFMDRGIGFAYEDIATTGSMTIWYWTKD